MKMIDVLRASEAKLLAERATLVAKLDEIPAAAFAASRSVTPDEKAEFDTVRDQIAGSDTDIGIDAKIDEVRSELAKLEQIVARQETSHRRAPVPGVHTDPVAPSDALRMRDSDARAAAVTFIERSRSFVKDEHRENLTNLIQRNGSAGAAAARMALVTGSDAYVAAWSKYMSGRSITLTEEERTALAIGENQLSAEERAGVTSGTGSSGGYFVPVFIDPTMIITGTGSINPLRKISTVKTIGPAFGGWYGATAAQVTAAWTAEAVAAPDNTPTITQPNIPVYMGEAFVQVSYQAFEDISDLAGDVLMLFQDAKDNLEAVAHSTADGSSKPKGVSYAVGAVTASRVSPATAGVVALADVFTVNDALPARFRNSGSLAWISSNVVQSKIRQLAMAQNSANSVWTDVNGYTPGVLLGANRYEASAMSASLTTAQDVLLFGDFSRYYIVDRIGFTTEFVPNIFDTSTGRPVAQRGWMAHWRTGADVVDVNAFRQLRL
jgi:HK97 family phage major capsid protein